MFIVDFHSHILPGMDDGSRSVEESQELLKRSYEQGIRVMAATSHFYAWQNTPGEFLARRGEAWERLARGRGPDGHGDGGGTAADGFFSRGIQGVPDIVPGAEVHYFEGISHNEEITRLRIGNSNVLLLEMPFGKWSRRMLDDIIKLNKRYDIQILMAHIERYLSFVGMDTVETLLDHGVMLQSNAEFFLKWPANRRALRMLKEGQISVLGSDCHNTTSRPPRLGEAAAIIERKLGREAIEQINECSCELLFGREGEL